jgi:uncharacterized protein YifE (UPF0438 family)
MGDDLGQRVFALQCYYQYRLSHVELRMANSTKFESQFNFRCSTAIFPADELAALADSGARLEALASGSLAPATVEEKRFLQVDRGEAEPRSVRERAWVRLKGRREYEEELAAAAPSPETEDYGIVEFDADRCWW